MVVIKNCRHSAQRQQGPCIVPGIALSAGDIVRNSCNENSSSPDARWIEQIFIQCPQGKVLSLHSLALLRRISCVPQRATKELFQAVTKCRIVDAGRPDVADMVVGLAHLWSLQTGATLWWADSS